MASILHIGLPLAPPWLTPKEAVEIATRLSGIRQRMEAAGYRYTVMHASPNEGLEAFRRWLQTESCDVVLIGGGVASNPNLTVFKQQIIDAAHEEAPTAKILDYDHSIDVPVLVGRALATS